MSTATFTYRDWTLADAIDALHAYDVGATDSGVSDDAMRAAVVAHLNGLDAAAFGEAIVSVLRELALSPEQLASGYGLEDAAGILGWLDEAGVRAPGGRRGER